MNLVAISIENGQTYYNILYNILQIGNVLVPAYIRCRCTLCLLRSLEKNHVIKSLRR